jgi:hypothetical protein
VKLTTHLYLVPRSKNAWSYTSTPHYAFMAWWCLVKHRDNFAFYLFTLNEYNFGSYAFNIHVMRRVLGLRMEETASRCGVQL